MKFPLPLGTWSYFPIQISLGLGLAQLQQVSEEIIYLVELNPVGNRKEDGNEMFLKFG